LKGFWRGNVPAELLYVAYGASQFTTYRSISAMLSPTRLSPSATAFVSGASAGAIATTMTYPLDLLRTRFAAQSTNRVYQSFIGSFLQITRQEGIRGLFQGVGAGIGQIVPYMGMFFATYEGLRPAMADMELPFGSGDAVAGIMASTIAKTSVFPLDLIRKRLQVQGPARSHFAGGAVPEYGKGVWSTGRAVVIKEGWLGLYRGLGVSLIKAAPASAVTMWTYERALGELQAWEVLQ
jgi:solute carrier family 25 thiamine pyrophosphate transporter 19